MQVACLAMYSRHNMKHCINLGPAPGRAGAIPRLRPELRPRPKLLPRSFHTSLNNNEAFELFSTSFIEPTSFIE